MELEIQQKIDNLVGHIHNDTDIYGCFIEMGCGVTVANALMGVAGATKTVYATECPYAREYQNSWYGNSDVRAVSRDSVAKIGMKWEFEFGSGTGPKGIPVTALYVASFQLGGDGSSCHGWILYKYKDRLRYYHISIHEEMTRKEYLQKIALCALIIIFAKNMYVPSDACIDIVENFDSDMLEMFDMIGHTTDDDFLCIRDGKFHRMEDFFREEKTILIFKGSFNPIHHGHVEIAQAMEAEYGAKPKLMISSEIYGKGSVDPKELKSRVEDLNKLGYDVVVSKSGFFNKNIEYIRKKFKQPIVFGVGADTLIRIFQSSYVVLGENPNELKVGANPSEISEQFDSDFDNAKLFVVRRDGYDIPEVITWLVGKHLIVRDIEHSNISSTQARSGSTEHIPEQIRDKYKK